MIVDLPEKNHEWHEKHKISSRLWPVSEQPFGTERRASWGHGHETGPSNFILSSTTKNTKFLSGDFAPLRELFSETHSL